MPYRSAARSSIFDVRPLSQRRRKANVQSAAAQLEALMSRRGQRGEGVRAPATNPREGFYLRIIIDAGVPGIGPNYDDGGSPI